MAKKLETIILVASLEKAAKKTNRAIWADLVERINAPTRNQPAVNIEKLNKIAKLNAGKILLVPGKVLAKGEFSEKVTVVAISASESAKAKIKASGQYISLKSFANNAEKAKLNEVIIVK